jgi:hypothetical protein
MSLRARLNHVEKLAGDDAADDDRLTVEHLHQLRRFLQEHGIDVSDERFCRDRLGVIRDLRAALAGGLRAPAGFGLSIQELCGAFEQCAAYREARKGA